MRFRKSPGKFLRTVPRDSHLFSDRFTPQCANPTGDNAAKAAALELTDKDISVMQGLASLCPCI